MTPGEGLFICGVVIGLCLWPLLASAFLWVVGWRAARKAKRAELAAQWRHEVLQDEWRARLRNRSRGDA